MSDVILISGSPRANGNTEYLLNVCKAEIESLGLTAKVITLKDKQIHGCIACGACKKLGKCALKDDLNDIIPDIKESAGFIVGTPVYFGTARGDVMNLLQRVGMVSRANGGWMAGKVGGPIAVGRRGGQTVTLNEMMMMYLLCGITIPGSNYWNIAFGQEPGSVSNDKDGIETIKLFARNVSNLIKKIHK